MNTLESIFPAEPKIKGFWHAIYLEPIVGSGEQISVAVIAISDAQHFKVVQAIRPELLDCLYGIQSENMQAMIDWIIDSARMEIEKHRSIANWNPPIAGVRVSEARNAADENIDGILRQAVRFTSSLSSLALDAERDDEDEQPRRYAENWVRSIAEEIKSMNPHILSHFTKKLKVSEADILTSYGFLTDRFVSNFGLLIPSRLSSSLSSVKAKLFDLESLKRSSHLLKPEKYELILGLPSFDDPTLTERSVKKLKETVEMISELATTEDIDVFQADSAKKAAEHIIEMAA